MTRTLQRLLRDNGLSLAFVGLFLVAGAGQSLTGLVSFNQDRVSHGLLPVGYRAFLRSGTFLDAMFVNWQAAVLQLLALVLFGAVLFQRGATHSRKPDEEGKPRDQRGEDAGWVYSHSMSLAFFLLFAIAFALHVHFGAMAWNEERLLSREPPLSTAVYLRSARCWTAVFACWEAEFFAIVAYVVFSVFLRQKDSPESKPVDAPDRQTGGGNT